MNTAAAQHVSRTSLVGQVDLAVDAVEAEAHGGCAGLSHRNPRTFSMDSPKLNGTINVGDMGPH
jgi:hypothetical protein